MKTPSQQFREEASELQVDISTTKRRMVNKAIEVIRETPPTPKTAQYSTGDFSKSHDIYINGRNNGKSLGSEVMLNKKDTIRIQSDISYADHVLSLGWDGKNMPGIWPGARHPAYRTYDVAVDEMNMLHMEKIASVFNAKAGKKR